MKDRKDKKDKKDREIERDRETAKLNVSLNQRFSTWGTPTPRGTRADYREYAKFKLSSK
jgi:hypothetical protein